MTTDTPRVMLDECQNCTVRGWITRCRDTVCHHHDSWYAKELKRELAAEKEEHAKAASFAVAVDHINAGLLVDVEVLEEKLAAAEAERIEDIRKCADMMNFILAEGGGTQGDRIRATFPEAFK